MKLMTLRSKADENINIAFTLNPAFTPDFLLLFLSCCDDI